MRCCPAVPRESTGEFSGSTATIRTAGSRSLRYRAMPVSVPPVPTPQTRTSISPAVAAQISGPVDA